MGSAMPVTWSDWSEEAFERARVQDKPILLYLAASWCPSCRYLDRELFGVAELADAVNRDYVAIRVDPDRRPDVNDRYNAGGWPTVAFLVPGGSLIWGTAAIELTPLRQAILGLRAAYTNQKVRILEELKKRDDQVEQARRDIYVMTCKLDSEIMRKTIRGILATFDPANGGFGREPKFALAASVQVLLSAFREVGGPDLREVTLGTLNALADHLFDPLDGGFFRYCETESWGNAHTEKMCEDNAALIRLFVDAWSVFDLQQFRDRAVRSLRWAEATLWDPATATFGASQAADEAYYASSKRGTAPPVDRTQIPSAAAAMSGAFLRAAAAFREPRYADVAVRCLDRIAADSLAKTQVHLMRALLDAHEYTGRPAYLESAKSALAFCRSRLWSDPERGILDRPRERELGDLARRRKNIQENAIAAEGAIRIALHTGDESAREWARLALTCFPDFLDDYGHYTSEYSLACDLLVRPVLEIDLREPTPEMRVAAFAPYVPRRVVRHRPGSGPIAQVRCGGVAMPIARTAEDLQARLADLP